MEDTQNSVAETREATKLGTTGQRNDTQSVTKRFVVPPAKHNSNGNDHEC